MARRKPALASPDAEALLARMDIVDLMHALDVPTRLAGRRWVARCPLHEDDDFALLLRRAARTWQCRACGAQGDALTFIHLRDNVPMAEAAARLAQLLERPRPADPPRTFTERELLERVAAVYMGALRESTPAQQYLVARALGGPDLWRAFGLGTAPGELDSMLSEKAGDGVREALVALGVLDEHGDERLAGCLVVPLHHPDGGVIALYGRRLAVDAAGPRHVFVPAARGVFNAEGLRLGERIMIAKSVTDALSLWTAGCGGATCLLDGALTSELGDVLEREGVREVSLVLDAPTAGKIGAALEARGIRAYRVVLPDPHDANTLLVDKGARGLSEALRQVHDASTSVSAETQSASGGSPGHREETGDGFALTFGPTRYQVTPRPPFAGRMRITLKMTHDGRRFYDNLDLFSHRARTACVNQLARLGVARAQAEHHVNRLTEETEAWVAGQPAADDGDAPRKPPDVLGAEREEALEFLRRPDLLTAILEDMDALGYVGEERAKLLAYLISVSRKLDRPLSGIVMSQSGAGKSALAELIESLTPPESVVLYSRLSAQALGYMPRDFLRRKLLILEERVGAEAADYQIRVLQSRQRLSQGVVVKDSTTGKMQTRHIEVEGPIAYIETTTSARINHENATRCFEIHLDESQAQTRRIHQRQREMRMDGWGRRPSADPIRVRHHNAQRLLEPVRVLLPYGPLLSFPSRWLRTRRDHERFLSLIDALAFLHQYQRERVEVHENGHTVACVRATPDDYRHAWELAQDVLGATLHELSRDARELLEAAHLMIAERGSGDSGFTRREIRHHTNWLDHRIRSALAELVQMEYVEVIGGSQGRTYQYQLAAESAGDSALRELTTPDELAAMLGEGA